MIYLSILSLLITPIFADTIGQVEYDLPPTTEEWQLAKQIQNEKSETRIYTPLKENSTEFFGAHINDYPTESLDEATLIKILATNFPDSHIEVSILSSTPDSVLYKWSVAGFGDGVTRAFSTAQGGTVMLTYQSQNKDEFEAHHSIWIKALEASKLNAAH